MQEKHKIWLSKQINIMMWRCLAKTWEWATGSSF